MSPGNAPRRTKPKQARTQARESRAWDKGPAIPAEAGYTKQELFTLWLNFKDQHDAVKVMMDFSLSDEDTAQQLMREFRKTLAKEE